MIKRDENPEYLNAFLDFFLTITLTSFLILSISIKKYIAADKHTKAADKTPSETPIKLIAPLDT